MHYGISPPKPASITIRVRMLRTMKAINAPGDPEKTYEAGQDYDLPEWLAEAFFKGGEGDPAEAHEQPSGSPSEPEATPVPDTQAEPSARAPRAKSGAKRA